MALDEKDHLIISELIEDGRLTNQELSKRINLSPTPCHRRVRMLEETGVIQGYTAVIDPKLAGYCISAFVSVKLLPLASGEKKRAMAEFEESVRHVGRINACYLMSGSNDYILYVRARSMEDYEQFMRNQLSELPGVASWETNFVFGEIKGRISGCNFG